MFWFNIKSTGLLASAVLISIAVFSDPADSTHDTPTFSPATAENQLVILPANYSSDTGTGTLPLPLGTENPNGANNLLVSQTNPPTSLIWILGSGLLGLIGLKRFGLNQ